MDSIFVYVDGIPCKGDWVDVDASTTWDSVRRQLKDDGIITDTYDGDLLVADANGLAARFLNSFDLFNLDEYAECAAHPAPAEAKAVWMYWRGEWSSSEFDDTYIGEYDSEEDYARESLEETGFFTDLPPMVEQYFDFHAYARDLRLNGDIYFASGHVFHRGL